MVCLTLGIHFGVSAQIWNATAPDLGIWGPPNNTGLAIAPGFDVQAAAFDEGAGSYRVHWIESATSTVTDIEVNFGHDPDVPYWGDASSLVVSDEFGGDIYIDEYAIVSASPIDYTLVGTTPVFGGTYSNIDVNSFGEGVLTWEAGGDIYAAAFSFPGVALGPVVPIISGTEPDIVLLDDNQTVALTYIDPNGSLHIMTLDYGNLQGGNAAITNLQGYDWLGNTAQFPRIAGQRNGAFGPPEDFTVVAQYQNSAFPEVYGVFSTGGGISTSPVLVNAMFNPCPSSDPRPVVGYDRCEVHVA